MHRLRRQREAPSTIGVKVAYNNDGLLFKRLSADNAWVRAAHGKMPNLRLEAPGESLKTDSSMRFDAATGTLSILPGYTAGVGIGDALNGACMGPFDFHFVGPGQTIDSFIFTAPDPGPNFELPLITGPGIHIGGKVPELRIDRGGRVWTGQAGQRLRRHGRWLALDGRLF
jgi:hypothetical protein